MCKETAWVASSLCVAIFFDSHFGVPLGAPHLREQVRALLFKPQYLSVWLDTNSYTIVLRDACEMRDRGRCGIRDDAEKKVPACFRSPLAHASLHLCGLLSAIMRLRCSGLRAPLLLVCAYVCVSTAVILPMPSGGLVSSVVAGNFDGARCFLFLFSFLLHLFSMFSF